MLTDFEAVVADLESYIHTKPSHGQRDLLLKLAELRVAHRVPEGRLDGTLRQMGVRVTREPLLSIVDPRPADVGPVRAGAMDQDDDHRSPDGGSRASTDSPARSA